jgi:hypothetical protein
MDRQYNVFIDQRSIPAADRSGLQATIIIVSMSPINSSNFKGVRIMNVRHFIAAAAVVMTGSVMAQEFVDPAANFKSARSRADVAAEAVQANLANDKRLGDHAYPVAAADVQLTRTRAEVVAEIEQARADGSIEVRDDSYPVLQTAGVTKTRAQVIAERDQYLRNRPLRTSDLSYSSGR